LPLQDVRQAGVFEVADHQFDLCVVAVLGLDDAKVVSAAGEDLRSTGSR